MPNKNNVTPGERFKMALERDTPIRMIDELEQNIYSCFCVGHDLVKQLISKNKVEVIKLLCARDRIYWNYDSLLLDYAARHKRYEILQVLMDWAEPRWKWRHNIQLSRQGFLNLVSDCQYGLVTRYLTNAEPHKHGYRHVRKYRRFCSQAFAAASHDREMQELLRKTLNERLQRYAETHG